MLSKLDASLPKHRIIAEARHIWWHRTSVAGWLEAFAAHPRIGDLAVLRSKYGAFADMSREEQAAAAAGADDNILQDLAVRNQEYYEKFNHIFIVCATGKTAAEMRDLIRTRYCNPPHVELIHAAEEQMKITELRLRKLFAAKGSAAPDGDMPAAATAGERAGMLRAHLAPGSSRAAQAARAGGRSPITTHVLDIASGCPAASVAVELHRSCEGSTHWLTQPLDAGPAWALVARGHTNQDGRCTDLLPAGTAVEGVYRRATHGGRRLFRPEVVNGLWTRRVPSDILIGWHRSCLRWLTFAVGAYQHQVADKRREPDSSGRAHPPDPFFPKASVVFQAKPGEHYHVPLTWSPFGYSTYRGS